MRVKVNGEIVLSDDKWLYDWCELENTAPSDIRRALEDLPEGEELVLEAPLAVDIEDLLVRLRGC